MRISYNWLADYVNPSWSPSELADRLTMSGLEVESVDLVGSELKGVVVGHVLESGQHPDADRLSLCSVDIGQDEPVQIVCGAPNVAAGQRVPVATVGTTLDLPDRKNPDQRVPVKLKKAKIRGQVSFGMICAEDELGLSEDHAGIMVLAEDAPVGTPFAEYMSGLGVQTADQSIDISITPNRPDAICHLGVARDVGALAGVAVCRPEVEIPENGGEAAAQLSVRIDAPDACHRYTGVLVRGVAIGESPLWLKQRLEAIGLRPRNNVVDITNYVMYECGQPLHAFDYDQIAGHQIIVRQTEAEGPFVTLDGKERTLPKGTLMIADGERDVAIAGVMGGENSEVSESTVNVLIESAWFEPSGIRRTAKALQLQTDASYRFERGVDPTGQPFAAMRAATLMSDLAGGQIVPGMVDCHPQPWTASSVGLRSARIEQILGVAIANDEVERLLTALGFGVETAPEGWTVSVPPYRPDVEREIDLIEEVARTFGLDRIPEPTHGQVPNDRLAAPEALGLRNRISTHLSGEGYREIYTNSMLRVDRAQLFAESALRGGENVGDVVRTLNPISQEMAALRPSLLPGALQVVAHNLNHGQAGLRLFEFGNVFDRAEDPSAVIPGYREVESLLVITAGSVGDRSWDSTPQAVDFFDVKGAASTLLEMMSAAGVAEVPEPSGSALTRYHLNLTLKGEVVGVVGCLSPEVADQYGIDVPVFFAELNFSRLTRTAAGSGRVQYQDVSLFPVVDRDVAVVVSRDQAVGPMLETIASNGGKLLLEQRAFDLYEGEHMAADRKSVAFGLRFGANRTLKDDEVDRAFDRIVKGLRQAHGAELRA